MSMTVAGLGIVAILVLIAISAVFSSTELAVFSIPTHRVEALAAEGTRRGGALAALREDPHSFLVTVLVSNNVANIAAASVATAVLVLFVDPGVAATVGTLTTSVVVIMLGELAPKSYAVAHPERHALRMARLVLAVQRVFWPVFVLFVALTRMINRLIGGVPNFAAHLTREEIETIVLSGEESGALDVEEGAMIRGVLELEETTVRGMMIPRGRMVTVTADTPVEAVIEACWRGRVTRVPVHDDGLDDVVGVVDLRDALRAAAEGLALEEVMAEAVFVPSGKPVDELLVEMQTEGHRMVLAVDEFGTVVGLATLEDAVEEVIGELFDSHEVDPVRIVDDDTAIVQGWAAVAYVNESVGTDLHTDGPFVTIAGLLNHHLGRLAEEGDRVEFDDAILTVLDTTARRIRRVRVDRVPPSETAGDGP